MPSLSKLSWLMLFTALVQAPNHRGDGTEKSDCPRLEGGRNLVFLGLAGFFKLTDYGAERPGARLLYKLGGYFFEESSENEHFKVFFRDQKTFDLTINRLGGGLGKYSKLEAYEVLGSDTVLLAGTTLQIKNMPDPALLLQGKGYEQLGYLYKAQIPHLQRLVAHLENWETLVRCPVEGFSLLTWDQQGQFLLSSPTDSFTLEQKNYLEKCPPGSRVVLLDIQLRLPAGKTRRLPCATFTLR